MLKGAQTSAPGAEHPVRGPHDLRQRQADEAREAGDQSSGVAARRGSNASRRAAIIDRSATGWSRRSDARLRWRTEGLEHFDSDRAGGRQPIMAFWHGRILPATYYFRHRGIVVITSENFDGEWIAGIIERFGYGTARGSTSRGAPQGAAAVDARHGGRPAGGIHRRRPARSCAGRPAGRRVAGEGHRESGAAVSPRGRSALDAARAGTGRRFRSRSHRGTRHGGAVRRAADADDAGDRIRAAGCSEARLSRRWRRGARRDVCCDGLTSMRAHPDVVRTIRRASDAARASRVARARRGDGRRRRRVAATGRRGRGAARGDRTSSSRACTTRPISSASPEPPARRSRSIPTPTPRLRPTRSRCWRPARRSMPSSG